VPGPRASVVASFVPKPSPESDMRAGIEAQTSRKPRSQMICDLGLLSVGVTGFEPATSSSRTKRATKLRHTPLQGALERTSVSLADNLGGSRMLTTIGA
jgi:hypothetical protein